MSDSAAPSPGGAAHDAEATFAELRERWQRAAADPDVDAEIVAIYAEAEREIEERRPICLASGHCCHFDRYGHDLFVTALEVAWFMRYTGGSHPAMRVAATEREDPRSSAGSGAMATRVEVNLPLLEEETGRRCPWLVGRLCGARHARPLGCRTFFCDHRAEAWSNPLHERLHARFRDLHDRVGVPYRYGEWIRMLNAFRPNT
ncbi:MAG: hypothetical protein KF724_10230 [Phycisphaeraceae bacterium]|nr:hypothetical protein [Phycisphaeraceae bacterium]